MRERVHENESGMMLVHRSYIGKRQRLVNEVYAKRYETVERAEYALADFVMKNPKFIGQLTVIVDVGKAAWARRH
jgi:hypothetical protein